MLERHQVDVQHPVAPCPTRYGTTCRPALPDPAGEQDPLPPSLPPIASRSPQHMADSRLPSPEAPRSAGNPRPVRPMIRVEKRKQPGGETPWRAPSRFSALPTRASPRWSTGCARSKASRIPPPAPGELRVATFTHLGETWQAIDTPGSIELLHVATDALLAADAAVVCVGPDPAAALLASPYLHAAEAAGTPAILFINRIDEATARVRDIVAALQDYAEHPIVLRQIPIREGGAHHRRRRPRLRARLVLPRGRALAAHRDPRRHARPRARGARRAARAPLRVRRPPARGADRGPGAAERRGLRHLRQGPRARTGRSRR